MIKTAPTDAGSLKKPTRMRRLLRIALCLGLMFVGTSWYFAYRLTGARPRAVGPPPTAFPFPVQQASWTTGDKHTIAGWFIPAEHTDRAIVLVHGYGGDRRSMLPRAKFFREAGYAVLLYDCRACGESSGDCITFGFRESQDLLSALSFLREKGLRRLACLGVSQGGANILLAAANLGDVRCVICESTFDELAHAVDNRFRRYLLTPGWLAGSLMIPIAELRTGVRIDQVKPAEQIGKLPCPVLVIGGAEDVKSRPEDTNRLFQAAPEPKQLWMVPHAGHRDLFTQPEYEQRVLEFLDRYMKEPVPAAQATIMNNFQFVNFQSMVCLENWKLEIGN